MNEAERTFRRYTKHMIRTIFQRLALIFFCVYLAILPGSTIVVALDRVPSWGAGMGGTLLLLQGTATLCWLLGSYGARGGWVALPVFLLAWAVEQAGVATGMPFGRYYYTGALQPQLFGTVPLAIPCAWLMVAAGAWQLATTSDQRPTTDDWLLLTAVRRRWSLVTVATLVLLLDLQIETVATKINHYWVWQDVGPYYGVPTANFVAWWLIGLVMALVVAVMLDRRGGRHNRTTAEAENRRNLAGLMTHVSGWLPAYLYLLSTLMFAIVNLARGYSVAGLLGLIVLLVIALAARPASARQMFSPGREAQ
jgi:bisanhydrobacterioruberin hydratase